MRNIIIIFLLILISIKVSASEVVPVKYADYLGVKLNLEGIPFEVLKKDFASGLTTNILIQANISTNKGSDVSNVIVGVFYDLWDEIYNVKISAMYFNDVVIFGKITDLNNYIKYLKIKKLYPMSKLYKDGHCRINIRVEINPIQKEKMALIQKWISSNSITTMSGDSGIKITSLGMHFNELFNKIFNQYTSKADALFKAEFQSDSYKISEIKNGK